MFKYIVREKLMKPLVSVIMPIYNQEKYLKSSIDCVMGQSLEALELILVNDGSTDGSLRICNEAAQKDSRIRVIDKKNGGVSSARNAGLCAAQGKYIGFADADDSAEPDFYETLYGIAEKNGCDLVSSCYYAVPEDNPADKKTDKPWFNEVDCRLGRDRIFSVVLPAMYQGFDCSVWNKLYKREIIEKNNLCFNKKLRIGEDYLFTLQYLFCAQSYYYTTYVGYHYLLRDGSAMQTFGSDYIKNYLRLYRGKKRLLRKAGGAAGTLRYRNRSWLLMIGEDFFIKTDGMTDRAVKLMRIQTHIRMTLPMKKIWHVKRPGE